MFRPVALLLLLASTALVAADAPAPSSSRIDLTGDPDEDARALSNAVALINAANQTVLDQAGLMLERNEADILRLSLVESDDETQLAEERKKLLSTFFGTWDPSLTADQRETLATRLRILRHRLSQDIDQIQDNIAKLRMQLITMRQYQHDLQLWIAANDTPLRVPMDALWFSPPLYPTRSASAAALGGHESGQSQPLQFSYSSNADPASLMTVHTSTPPPLLHQGDTGLFSGQDGTTFDTTHINK